MTIVNRLKREFAKYGDPETKPENLTWRKLAETIGSTKEACKVEWRKYRRRRPSVRIQKSSDAKILIFDLETSPILANVWRCWKENINYNQVEQDWFLLTWSAKWLWEDEVYSDKLAPKEVEEEDDSRIVKTLWNLIDEADIVVAHNALGFDQKRMNTRFLLNGLDLPRPFQVIDTLIHARKHLAMTSNKLDYLGQILGVGEKVDTGGFDLWKRCMKGDKEALEKMEVYNIGDVQLLERVYLEMIKYIKPHPNIGLLQASTGKLCCASCGSDDLHEHGEYLTTVSAFQAYKCGNCGSLSRSRKQLLSPKQKEHLTVSIPK